MSDFTKISAPQTPKINIHEKKFEAESIMLGSHGGHVLR
jgi:hypothetical protein